MSDRKQEENKMEKESFDRVLIEASVGAIERYNTDPEMDFLSFKKKFRTWAEVEIAIVKAKAKLGLIPVSKEEIKIIEKKVMVLFGERKIDTTVKRILDREKITRHDLKAFLDVIANPNYSGLSEKEASYIHAGVTSYDIEDPALALNMTHSVKIIRKDLRKLKAVLKRLALKYKYTLQIFRTHGVHAQPGTFGLKILRWYFEVGLQIKDLDRLLDKVSMTKISGAVGTHAEIGPEVEELALKELGLKVCPVSSQIVTRKIHADFVYQMASIAASLDKFATEIRNLQRTEIAEVAEPFGKGQVGSSAMPHKRNPMMCENICSLARLVISFVSVALLNQNTWHERDLANSGNERFILPYTAILVHHMIKRFTKVMENLNVYPEQMRKNLEKTGGLIYSSRVMLALANRGIPREDAHRLVQKITQEALQERKEFKALISQDSEIELVLTPEEIEQCFDPNWYLREIGGIYSRFPEFISEDLSKL